MTRLAAAVAAVVLLMVAVTAGCSETESDKTEYVAAFDDTRRQIAELDTGSDGLVIPQQMGEEQRHDAREMKRIATAFDRVEPPTEVAPLHRRYVVALRGWGENLERTAELAGRPHGVDERLRSAAERFYRADDELWAAVDEWRE